MDLKFFPDKKGAAREVGGMGARGGRTGGGCCGGCSPAASTTMPPPPSASGSASMLISPLLNWSACLVARWDSRADLTLKRAGQNGQRLFMTCWCARNWPFLSLARVFWVIIQYCCEISWQVYPVSHPLIPRDVSENIFGFALSRRFEHRPGRMRKFLNFSEPSQGSTGWDSQYILGPGNG